MFDILYMLFYNNWHEQQKISTNQGSSDPLRLSFGSSQRPSGEHAHGSRGSRDRYTLFASGQIQN